MKKLLLLLLLLVPSLAKAQGYLEKDIALNQNGKPIPSPVVTVCVSTDTAVPCTNKVSVFSDAALTVSITNPLPACTQTFQVGCADQYGNYSFYIAPGTYAYTITGHGTVLQGPFIITIPCVTGSSCGGGGGSVGPGTVNHISKFTTTTNVGDSTCTDDGVNPTRCPNGMNTAGGGNYAEWVVDTGGVVANKLACRSSNNKAQICAAGITQGVLGVAQATVASGGTALVCYSGKCSVISSNATTAGHWLIPSASVAGDVDDTGSFTKPTTATQTLPAETSVAGGNAVLTTFLSPDTLGGGTGGSGTVNPALQYSEPFYSAAGTSNVIDGLSPPTANGKYQTIYNVTANAAVAKTLALPGVATRTVAGTTDTILYSDRAGLVDYTSNSAIAITVPQAGSTGFTSNTVFKTRVSGSASATFTPTTSTVNGSATLVQNPGTVCTWYSDNTNYKADCSISGSAYNTVASGGTSVTQRTKLNFIQSGSAAVACVDNSGSSQTDCTISGINGPPSPQVFIDGNFSYTTVNSDNQERLALDAPGAGPTTITQPQAGTISVAPFVRVDDFQPAACTSCVTGTFIIGAGNIKSVYITWTGNSTSVLSVADSAGNSWSRVAADRYDSGTNFSGSMWKTLATTGSGADTLTITMSGSTSLNILTIEHTTISFIDHADSSFGTDAQVTIPVSYKTVVAVAAFSNAGSGCPSGWTFRTSLGLGAFVLCDRIYDSVASSNFHPIGVTSGVVFNSDYAVTGTAGFLNGWYNVVENFSNNNPPPTVVVTPTTSEINGAGYGSTGARTKLNIFPNEWCANMSDGANYNAICGTIPNTLDNGVNGGNVTIFAHPQTASTSSIGATTMYATQSSPVSNYLVGGYADVTVVGTSCASNTTVVLNAIYTDPNGAGATTRAIGTFTIVNNGTAGDNFGFPMTPLRAKGSTNIQFSTTYTAGGSCSPAPTVQVTPILQVM